VDVEQQASCRLRAAALDQCLRGGERPALNAVVRQQARYGLQEARIVIDHDHDCRLPTKAPPLQARPRHPVNERSP
jgi:hypothetical protein